MACFWSLLSLDNLEFIHIPSSIGKIRISTENGQTTLLQDVLLHHSLFDFMHPNEIKMAKNDLSSFLKLNTLAGSVTRCRLLSLQSMACHVMSNRQSSHQGWNIIDLVIYTATDDTVLAFFHNIDFGACHMADGRLPSCAVTSDRPCFDDKEAFRLIQALESRQKTDRPVRIFQIIDSTLLKPLFVWPQLYPFVEMVQSLAKEIVLKEFKNPSTADHQVACSRHFYANGKIELYKSRKDCNFQRILIPYGSLLFESIQVSPMPSYSTTTTATLASSAFQRQPTSTATARHDTELIPQHTHRRYQVNHYQRSTTTDSVYSPSSQLRKFRVQQRPQQEVETIIKQQHGAPASIEKKKRNAFLRGGGGDATTLTSLPEGTKICTRCHTSNSPEWRRGPDGHKTLCNACGLRYSRFRSKQWRSSATAATSSSPSASSASSSASPTDSSFSHTPK